MKKLFIVFLLCFLNQTVLSADFSCVGPNGASKMITFFNQIDENRMESGLLPPNQRLIRTNNKKVWEYTNSVGTKALLEIKSAHVPRLFEFSLYNSKGSTTFVYQCNEILQAK